MRRATGNTLQPHQILRLPRIMNVMIEAHHRWNVIYNARSNRQHPPTSPNAAPATHNECHDWATSQMKRHLQCAEQQATPSNLTKYCACHAKWPPKIRQKIAENRWSVISNARPIRDRSDHDPSMIRPRKRKPQPATPQRLPFALARSRFYWKLQRFPLRQSFQISPNAAPATKSDTWTSPNAAPATKSDTWTSPDAAPGTKSDTWTSPNAAPGTKSETWTSPNAAPATKSETWTSPNAAPATHNECHDWATSQMKQNVMIEAHHRWNVIYNARSNRQHPPTSPNTAPATQNDHPSSNARPIRDRSDHDPTQKTQTATRHATEATFRIRQEQILLKITTFPAPAIIPNFTKCCTCHKKWHMNFTKCCTWHKKWHMNFTKCCTWHKKWNMNFY